MLYRSWERLWPSTHDTDESQWVRDRLIAQYSETHRHYHTCQHLEECISLLNELDPLPACAAQIELALWFHDAVYDVYRNDNEEKSAQWAEACLRQANRDKDTISSIKRLVIATKHTSTSNKIDEMLIMDIDLAILGAKKQRFVEYEQQIRREYGHVPESIYREKRRAVLESFSNCRPIYLTDHFRARFEKRAEHNLQEALKNLS